MKKILKIRSPLYLSGYSIYSNNSARHKALLHTISRVGLNDVGKIVKKLRKLSLMNKGYNDVVYKLFKDDAKWLEEKY